LILRTCLLKRYLSIIKKGESTDYVYAGGVLA
jgi:hypothetical protein